MSIDKRHGNFWNKPGSEEMNWKYFGSVHKVLYKLSGGRFGAKLGNIDCVLVDAVGRKSGKTRTVPICCYPYKDSVVVSASNSGMETPPAWYFNLKANPECTAQLGTDRFAAVAEELPKEEADTLLPMVFKINDHQRQYREQTERYIPLVWLRRV